MITAVLLVRLFKSNPVSQMSPTSTTSIAVSGLAYDRRRLDFYYLQTNSVLIDAGNIYATNASLFHFSTATNQIKEGISIVDLAYHYVARDFAGKPVDADGDGIADYLENVSGTGSLGTEETDWQSYNSLFGIGTGPGLQVYTPLKP